MSLKLDDVRMQLDILSDYPRFLHSQLIMLILPLHHRIPIVTSKVHIIQDIVVYFLCLASHLICQLTLFGLQARYLVL